MEQTSYSIIIQPVNPTLSIDVLIFRLKILSFKETLYSMILLKSRIVKRKETYLSNIQMEEHSYLLSIFLFVIAFAIIL